MFSFFSLLAYSPVQQVSAGAQTTAAIISWTLLGILFIGIAYLGYVMWIQKTSFEDIMKKDASVIFKTLSTVLSVGEIVTLAILAIARGVDVFQAFMRYGGYGMLEIITSVYFISAFSKSLTKSISSKGYYNIIDWFRAIFLSLVPGLMCFGVTAYIYFLYIESVGHVITFQTKVTFFTSIFYTTFATPMELKMETTGQHIEAGVAGLIFASQAINVLVLYHFSAYVNGSKFFLGETTFNKAVERGEISAFVGATTVDTTTTTPITPPPVIPSRISPIISPPTTHSFFQRPSNMDALANWSDFYTAMFGSRATAATFEARILALTGMNIRSQTPSGTPPTGKTAQEAIDELENELIEEPNYGFKVLFSKADGFALISTYVETLTDAYSSATDPAVKEEYKKDYLAVKSAYDSAKNDFTSVYNSAFTALTNKGFPNISRSNVLTPSISRLATNPIV